MPITTCPGKNGAMVCETPPRLRSLLVSRRGGFLEDPFFRDAWGDYNNAVRRIVDRFNHGGVFAPRDRLRDSHYHSMYRTLRSARINYAAQSARFKDEGSVYKLVMDVREFVGGDLTVRTAGGTLSVRGRLETGAGSDADSGSSRASSARTLHRRFNLPPDADGEKVESMLSRDAVLTVTIPKRTDVRVIPVRVEGDGSGRSGTKRHSASQPDPGPSPSKRPQDHAADANTTHTPRGAGTSARRQVFGSDDGKREERSRDDDRHRREEAQRGQDRTSKRGSDVTARRSGNKGDDDDDVGRKGYADGSARQVDEDEADGDKENFNVNRRRSRDTSDEDPEAKAGQRSRRRISKYEEAKEINIPIRLERSADPNAIVQPTKGVGTTPQSEDNDEPSPGIRQGPDKVPPSPTTRVNVENGTSDASVKAGDAKAPKEAPKIHVVSEKENIKPSEDERGWTYSGLYHNKSRPDAKEKESHGNKTKPTGSQESEPIKKVSPGVRSSAEKRQVVPEVRVPPGGPLAPAADGKHDNHLAQSKAGPKDRVQGRGGGDEKRDAKAKNTDAVRDETAGQKDYLRNTSQESGSPEGRSKSPFGGREVKVEKKQSDMEGDMFKDCWQNFSSTLQEVLARLQELSAELGHAKPQTKPSPPPTDALKGSGQQTPGSQTTSSQVSCQESPEEEVNKSQRPVSFEGSEWLAGKTGTSAGVGGAPPTTSSPVYADERSATRSEPSSRGPKYASTHQDVPARRKNNENTGSAGLRPRTQQVTESSVPEKVRGVPLQQGGAGGGGGGGARARDNARPVSLVLPDRAQDDTVGPPKPMSLVQKRSSDGLTSQTANPQSNGAAVVPRPRPRPTSLDVSHEGPLLKNLRKSSPVDALKDKFLSEMTPTSESSSGTDVHYIPVEVEAKKTVPTRGVAAEDASSRGARKAPGVPLHERRGKGVDNLVIAGDDECSTDSSEVSTSASESQSVATSSSGSGGSESGVDEEPQWPVPSRTSQLEKKPAAGNSRALNPVPDPLQQHSSSGGGDADSRVQQLHGIGSGTGTGGSCTQPSPLLPSASSSDSDTDVDEIISQAERVIEETRRLSATTANDLPAENDLGRDKAARVKREVVRDATKPAGFNLAPNIEARTSPESNFVQVHDDEEDSEDETESQSEEGEVIVEGCLSIPLPTARPRQPRHTPPAHYTPSSTAPARAPPPPTTNDSLLIEAVDDTDDVTECDEVRPTIVTSPEIQSSDVMGCARESGRGGRSEAPPSPREARPRTLTHEAQPTPTPRRPSSRERMGGLFSRGRTEDSSSSSSHPSPATSSSGKPAPPSPQTPSTPTRTPKLRERSCTPQDEPPPYVRQKAEPTKRYSGFSHVQSDNVRKMRDVWSTKQESPPLRQQQQQQQQQARRGARVPTTPPPSPRRVPPDSPSSSFSRVTPTRETPSASPTRTNNFYNSTFSSRSRSSSSPRRGSTSESTEGVAPSARDGSRNTSASAKSTRPLADNNSPAGSPGPRPSAARKASRTQRASPTRRAAPDRHTPTSATPPEPPPASPFHHKLFRRLRDSSLQPDSETICFTEEEDRYKLVMDVEEYVPGEIEVLQDDKHLTVKGRVETTQRGNTTTRTFHRNFHIPHNTREEEIDSALSKDGILTVYVPKKKERVIKIELTD
ncbi:uncharacterized protein [Panulirus ornatus]|uniref:uncharacterized protein isoform X2 n=1 Tax=Panulirus ornatus TaxID=150431 RepID=UPI003A842B70